MEDNDSEAAAALWTILPAVAPALVGNDQAVPVLTDADRETLARLVAQIRRIGWTLRRRWR